MTVEAVSGLISLASVGKSGSGTGTSVVLAIGFGFGGSLTILGGAAFGFDLEKPENKFLKNAIILCFLVLINAKIHYFFFLF